MTSETITNQEELAAPSPPRSFSGEEKKFDDVQHNEITGVNMVKFEEQGQDGPIHGARSKWEDLDAKSTFRLFWKGALVCFFAAFSSFTDGYQIAIIGNIIGNRGFIDQMGTEVSRETGLLILAPGVLAAWTAIGSVCQWLAMIIFPFVSDRFGRRTSMLCYWLIIAAGVAAESGARNWKIWTVAKVFSGFGVGAMQFSLQVYISELAPTARIRGTLLSCYNLWWTLGLFIGTIAITMEGRRDPHNWITIVLTQWAQVGLMGIIYVFIPESPWWHVKKGMKEKGMKTLNRLYGKIPGYDVEEEYEILAATIQAEEAWASANKEIEWQAIFRGVNGWRTFVSAWSLTAITFVGQSFLSTYTIYFFETAGSTDPFANTCITSGLGIVSVLFLVTCLDRLGRRRIVCYLISTMWVCLFLIGCIGLKKDRNANLNRFLIALACIWSVAFYAAAGAGWSLCGEVSNARLRARTTGFAASMSVLIGIPINYGTPYMISVNSLNWGLKTCFFFAGLSAPFVIGTWFVLPETSGRSPAELDEMFEAKVKPWRFRKYVTRVEDQQGLQGTTQTE